jgi:Tfp pilus assembly protein PilZ
MDPSVEFWGVAFSPPPESIQPKVLIECQACGKAELVPLSRVEYDLLLHTGLIARHCEPCGETTRWQPSAKPPVEWTQAKIAVHDERRKTRRLQLSMRLQVRKAAGQTEIVQTMDVSRGGICFFSKQAYAVGEQVSIILPFGQEKAPVETPGRVVWVREAPGGALYGVTYVTAAESKHLSAREQVAQAV